MTLSESQDFLSSVPLFAEFEGVADATRYLPLPDDWVLALADIVDSTRAIAEGQYKLVNMAGAAVIPAVLNALGRHDLPYAFGGDGGNVALPGAARGAAEQALASLCRWSDEEFGLTMRAALVPVSEIRRAGFDLRVARFRASDQVSFAMFAGGGATWAESQMKAGAFGVAPAPPGSRPDLAGLSCRFDTIRAQHGQIVSLIVVPGPAPEGFPALVNEIVALAGEEVRAGHPVPETGPPLHFSPAGFRAEGQALAAPGKRLPVRLKAAVAALLVIVLHRLNRPLGRFDARRYTRDVAMNTDFRKYDDGLKMTVELDADRLARIEARLATAQAAGLCRYGLHKQDAALMTCFVPTPLARDHVHFVDGASGGYAQAANQLKGREVAPG